MYQFTARVDVSESQVIRFMIILTDEFGRRITINGTGNDAFGVTRATFDHLGRVHSDAVLDLRRKHETQSWWQAWLVKYGLVAALTGTAIYSVECMCRTMEQPVTMLRALLEANPELEGLKISGVYAKARIDDYQALLTSSQR